MSAVLIGFSTQLQSCAASMNTAVAGLALLLNESCKARQRKDAATVSTTHPVDLEGHRGEGLDVGLELRHHLLLELLNAALVLELEGTGGRRANGGGSGCG